MRPPKRVLIPVILWVIVWVHTLYSAGGHRHTGCVVVCLRLARLSQDLAKDLAILAREIHDVAGEAEPGNSATEAQVPVAPVTAHEEVPRTGSKSPARQPVRDG